ncbi:NAD(P)/FAD-dependent oxidoreductase [Nocardioides sp. SLBN-35]|uniref:flavin monoamine oxidase family protein n=1 Tax=Nocardioides sp. SLBN-35 TaxID=2768445 RepID=UPI00114E831B|nr:NAD(P)/FAD-dependent oxidoreductase [Nocardioides sp. SLBN-35]TQK68610.1 monoamine oxidase [Nocardioides sp. SLBN-35]
MDAQVVVVGAGLSGLVAARELVRGGADVMVLEAADRVGGRVLAETSALGSRLDLGGTWIGHDHHRIRALAEELGATPFPMHTGALPLLADGERRLSPAGPSFAPALAAVAALAVASQRWRRHPGRRTTLADRLRRVPGRRSRRLLEVLAEVSWSTDPGRLSTSTVGDLVRLQGGLRTMLSTKGGAQDTLVVEGIGTLVEILADGLGDRVRLGCRVGQVTRGADGITLDTTMGPVRASAVVITVPPPTAARIVHEPPLPAARTALEQGMEMGTVHKAVAVYQRPFWRKIRGGELILLGSPGGAVFDTSPPDGPGHLTFLAGGADARALDALDPAARRTAILDALAPHLGEEVRRPAGWHEKSWHLDEHAGGGYIALPLPGTTVAWPTATPALGGLHWAGAESAEEHPGYLDGAVESGLRVAAEVLDELSPTAART